MDCYPYPDMMTDMLPQVETVRAAEDRGTTMLVFTDTEGNWTLFAFDGEMNACVIATGTKWMMMAHNGIDE